MIEERAAVSVSESTPPRLESAGGSPKAAGAAAAGEAGRTATVWAAAGPDTTRVASAVGKIRSSALNIAPDPMANAAL
jgi:hypothetical protein